MAQARLAATPDSATLPDGVYLYSNSPKPNQVSQNYVVFERHQGKVVGAFYSPQSEFTCFAGELEGTQLDVEEQVPEEVKPQAVRAELAQLYPLQTISANDHRMLRMCQQATTALANPS
ncbi:hypothetical protein H6F51_10400 [Cyanobacteria bacterium FACHB-DQ100]|nr:hypothetical protein [Cyanobacteria bacterium FACHB-DQ100]